MSSLSSIHEGTLSAKPLDHARNGLIHAGDQRCNGRTLRGTSGAGGGSLRGDASESPQNAAAAEVSSLISSLGSLSAQAGSMPLTPPTLPGLPQNTGYQPQALQYGFSDGAG